MVKETFDVINIEQLEILGFTKEYRNLIYSLIGIFICYLIIKPVVTFLNDKQYMFVLTYLICSMLFITIIAHIYNEHMIMKSALLSVVLFGLCLVFYLLYRFLKDVKGKSV